MNLIWIIIVVLLVLALVGAPGLVWQHSYGYAPSGVVTVILVVLLILLLTGRL